MYSLEFTDKELSVLQRMMHEEAERLSEVKILPDVHQKTERDVLLSINRKMENAQQKEITQNVKGDVLRKVLRTF